MNTTVDAKVIAQELDYDFVEFDHNGYLCSIPDDHLIIKFYGEEDQNILNHIVELLNNIASKGLYVPWEFLYTLMGNEYGNYVRNDVDEIELKLTRRLEYEPYEEDGYDDYEHWDGMMFKPILACVFENQELYIRFENNC